MIIDKFGAIPVQDVKMLEQRYSICLPIDYFEYLCSVGGGIAEKPNNELYIDSLTATISIDVLFGLNTKYKNANIDLWTDKYLDEMPHDTIIIGDTLEHGFIVLLCSGEDAGVYYWDDTHHYACSTDDSNTYFIADTFSDFIKNLL